MQFDLSKSEQCDWLANLVSSFRQNGVQYSIEQDANIVTITPKQ